jgi:hypothetical protein
MLETSRATSLPHPFALRNILIAEIYQPPYCAPNQWPRDARFDRRNRTPSRPFRRDLAVSWPFRGFSAFMRRIYWRCNLVPVHLLTCESEREERVVYYFDEVAYRVACAQRRLRTLKQQARAVGLSEAYLGQITRGALPSDDAKAKVAQALGLQVSDLWKPVPTVAA